MHASTFTAVDDYFSSALLPDDPVLADVLRANAAAGLPPHDVSPLQGRFLQLLVRLQRAEHILEVGTLGAYSTICMARALPPGGKIVTLEANPAHAAVARRNIARAALEDRIELLLGPALTTLPTLQPRAPFDLIFIDADKPNNPQYLQWALKLSRPGTLLIVDNVVRNGAVAATDSTDPNVHGVRAMTELIHNHLRLTATALQTVGVKGYDGLLMALVN